MSKKSGDICNIPSGQKATTIVPILLLENKTLTGFQNLKRDLSDFLLKPAVTSVYRAVNPMIVFRELTYASKVLALCNTIAYIKYT